MPSTNRRTVQRAREAFVLAAFLFVFTWTMAVLASWGRYSDFVQFYTLAHIADAGDYGALRSDSTFQAWQVRVLPESRPQVYPSVYPPQMAFALRMAARLTYWQAYATLVTLSVVACLWTVRRMAATQPSLAPWPRHVVLLTAGSPFLWSVVVQGQVSALALLVLSGAWSSLGRGRRYLAGLALGLLAYKAPLFVVAMAVMVLAGEWVIVAGGVAGAALEYLLAVPAAGSDVVVDYLIRLAQLALAPDRLAEKFVMLHSWRTFWTALLPPSAALVAYAVTGVATVWGAAWAWRRLPDPLHRTATLGAAIVLGSPHLFAYDLVLLFPLTVASAEFVVGTRGSRLLTALTAAGCFAPMWSLPVALLGLQGSTPVLAAWLIEFVRVASRSVVGVEAAAALPAEVTGQHHALQ